MHILYEKHLEPGIYLVPYVLVSLIIIAKMFSTGEKNTRIRYLAVQMPSRIFARKRDVAIFKSSSQICSISRQGSSD